MQVTDSRGDPNIILLNDNIKITPNELSLYPYIDQFQPSSRKLLFAVDGDLLSDLQLTNVQSIRDCRLLCPTGIIFIIHIFPNHRDYCGRGKGNCM